MIYTVVDPAGFLQSEMFRQDEFLEGLRQYDWGRLAGKKVLVRGCGDTVTPPWAYMAIAARLVGIARSVRYGNEHDNVIVYRTDGRE